MEGLVVLLVLLILGLPLGIGIWLIARAVNARTRLDELTLRLEKLESDITRLKREPKPAPSAAPQTEAESVAPPAHETAPQTKIPPPEREIIPPQPTTPPPLPPIYAAPALPISRREPAVLPESKITPVGNNPPPTPPAAPKTARTPRPAPSINWEQFMGVKLFAWIGGIAAFLGVAFFIKYSFDNNLIPPELRAAIGFLVGIGLLVGGTLLHRRKQYTIGAQVLCATGVIILYAVTFACRAWYHFPFFDVIPTFLLMVLITTTAFFVAVRFNALVVAVLGMLGGFLTPLMLSTNQDNPLGLFGYIAILNVGLIVVALNRRWHFLTALAAVGTAIMQIGWIDKFFVSENYFVGNKIFVALAVLAGFNALYLIAAWWAKKKSEFNWWLAGSSLGLAAVALGFTGWFLSFDPLAHRPWLMFSFVFLIDAGITALAWMEKRLAPTQGFSGLVVFGILAGWTGNWLTNDLLNPALAFIFIFAVIHAAFPIFLQRQRNVKTTIWSAQLFPPLALLLVLIPIFKLTAVSFAVWPFVLLVDLLAIGLAALTASLLPVLAVLLLTIAATGALLTKIPATLTGMPTSFFLIGGFAVFFVLVSVWLVRKLKPGALGGLKLTDDFSSPDSLAALLPAFSAILPFLLLIMATLRLPLADPSPVFGVALLLVVLLLGVAKLFSQEFMPIIGLVCVAALEGAWHANRFDPTNLAISPTLPLTWYLIFFGVFFLFPFLFLKKFSEKVTPWAAAALIGLPQFFLIYRLVKAAWPNEMMGLLPAAFAIPPLLGLVVVLKKIPAEVKARLSQLAFFGGVGLFFITLIFPIQFDKQWITIGWALEGAALMWLFQRVPHPGLRLTGFGLLIASFVRLALNPAVFEYHYRTATPIFNWYLYTYGIVTVCLFAAARLLAAPRNRLLGANAPAILNTLGTILAFILLNIEIADAFTPAGSMVTFRFIGHLDSDIILKRHMTYSIAWGLFSLALLTVGIVKRLPASRYAAIGLLSVTILKLFIYDLSNLNQLYRIGALVGIAIIATLASLAYQRFFATTNKETTDEPVQ